MSCKRHQEEINEALAAVQTALSAHLAAHLRTCGECLEYYEGQRQLLASIDAGVRAMVSEEAPASLLPRVRACMEPTTASLKGWRPAWFTAAATAALAITFGVLRHNSEQNPLRTNPGGASSDDSAAAVLAPNAPDAEQHAVQKQTVWKKAIAPSPELPDQRVEVIVLADQREAFARFVAELPKEKESDCGTHAPSLGARGRAG